MNRPDYAENFTLGDEFISSSNTTNKIKVEKGAYVMKICNVVDFPQYEKLVLYVDFVEGDNKGAFAKASLGQTSSWDRKGQVSVFYGNKSEKQFSAFVTSVVNSNPGFVWDWDERKLVNKFVVVVYGEEEFIARDGSIAVAVKPRFCRSTQALHEGKVTIPERKKLIQTLNQPKQETYENYQNYEYGNQNVEIDENDLPF